MGRRGGNVIGMDGISLVASATGISRTTIKAGVRELSERSDPGAAPVRARVRHPGGGSKPLVTADPEMLPELEALVAPETRGDPMSPLRWTCKSTEQLAAELTGTGTRCRRGRWRRCSRRRTTACRATARRARATSTPTATPSSGTSTPGGGDAGAGASRWCRWTPKRRNWWGISRTAGGSGGPRASPRRCGCTTSWTRRRTRGG